MHAAICSTRRKSLADIETAADGAAGFELGHRGGDAGWGMAAASLRRLRRTKDAAATGGDAVDGVDGRRDELSARVLAAGFVDQVVALLEGVPT